MVTFAGAASVVSSVKWIKTVLPPSANLSGELTVSRGTAAADPAATSAPAIAHIVKASLVERFMTPPAS
jgi:hypothetical protein